MFDGFVCGGAVYGKFVGVREDLSPIYDKYPISNVIMREKFAVDEDMMDVSHVVLYFIHGKSVCKNDLGTVCPLPKPRAEDVVFMNSGTDSEITYKVREAGYFIGAGEVEYTRLKLM